MTGTFDWTLSERAIGTDVNVRVEYEFSPGGAFGKGIDAALLQRLNQANMRRTLQNLKQLAEGHSGQPTT